MAIFQLAVDRSASLS